MSRILVLGASPLPLENLDRQYAANLRTWHFTKPIIDAGHDVRLLGCRLPKCYPEGEPPVSRRAFAGCDYFSIVGDKFHDNDFLSELCEEFQPDAVVGVNTYPSSRAVELRTDVPIWCDLNGWVMAEAQSKCFVYDDDTYLSHFWKMEEAVLLRADAISTVSDAQQHATVGELAALGRLSSANFGYDFVKTIPNAINQADFRGDLVAIRGQLVPEDSFVVLWVGGYNTWTDVDLLFESLSTVMKEFSTVHFVSTGGAIDGHDELTFDRFVAMAEKSPFSERFHFVGWVPTEHVPSYYAAGNLGLNVDSDNYETVYGARNRLNEMMKAGLPMLTTLGTEISSWVRDNGLGLSAPTHDAVAFAAAIRWAVENPRELAEMAQRATVEALHEFSYQRTTRPLLHWLESPRRAPDLGERISFENIDFFGEPKTPENLSEEADEVSLELQERASELEADCAQLRAELDKIHHSRMWKLWMFYLRPRIWLRDRFGI